MRAIIVGALILAGGAFVTGCRRDQGAQQQETQQSGQPAAQPDAPAGTGGGGQSGTSQDRVIPPGSVGSPQPDSATGTSPDTGPVQRGPAGSQSGGTVVPPPTPPPDKETRGPRSQPDTLGLANVNPVSPQQEETDTRDDVEVPAGLPEGSDAQGQGEERDDFIDNQEEGIGGAGTTDDAPDDTLPHTMPEMQEGIGGSGPVEQGDVDPPLPDEPQFPEEPLFIPPLEALKPFSEGQQGTGGSGTGGMTRQAPTAQRNPVVGQVHARNGGQVVVQDVQRDVYALTLAPDACISRDGKAISLEQLNAGDTVRARWSVQDGKRVATWVDVLRDSQSSPQQGTGGSGMDDGSGTQEPMVEPLGNDEFQGH